MRKIRDCMKKTMHCIFITALFIGVDSILSLAQVNINNTSASTLDIYRHYTGTIGSDHVVLDLRYGMDGGSNYGGSACYYIEKNLITNIMIRYPGPDNPPMDADEEFREY